MNLFISTATNYIYVVTFSENNIVQKYIEEGQNNHTQLLYQLLDNVDIENIENIYIVNGPGSYTGLRVGMIFAKTMNMQRDINLIPVHFLKLLSLQNDNKNIAFDARGKKYFYYDNIDTSLISIDEVNQNDISDGMLDVEKIITNKLLSNFSQNNNLEIEYGKPAL